MVGTHKKEDGIIDGIDGQV